VLVEIRVLFLWKRSKMIEKVESYSVCVGSALLVHQRIEYNSSSGHKKSISIVGHGGSILRMAGLTGNAGCTTDPFL